jgi:uncharacterized protein (DUF305 family)
VSRGRILAIAVAAVVALVGVFALGRVSAGSVEPTPSTDSAAAGFLRDMQVHHAQAVEMAMLVRDRTDDPAVRQLAYDIAITQASQSGSMYGLLEAWDLPQLSPRPAMTWTLLPTIDGSSGGGHQMDADAPNGMPGMATPAEIDQLEAAEGDDAVRLFLTLMIAHHEGGVAMAEAVLARTDVPQVVSLATGMERAQRAEIVAMRDLLADVPG